MCVGVCLGVAQEESVSDLTHNLKHCFDLPKLNGERDAHPSQRGLNIPESGHHNFLSPPSFHPSSHFLLAGGKGELQRMRRGEEKVKGRLFKLNALDSVTHTEFQLPWVPALCSLGVCVQRGIVWVMRD